MESIQAELARSLAVEAEELERLRHTLDLGTLEKVVRLIGECKGRTVTTGCGTSAMAAKKIAHSLNCIERPAFFLTPSDAVHGGLGAIQGGDILILISKGGGTQELVRLLPAAQTKGVTTIAVTENETSALGTGCDVCVRVKVEREPCRFNMLATASTLAVIAAFDAVCIALMQVTSYTREQFAVIHPGGAVGDRLLGKKEEAK